MKTSNRYIISITVFTLFLTVTQGNTAKVFLLAGQSNMAGHGVSNELDSSLLVGPDNVKIWATYQDSNGLIGTNGWARVTPDFGDWSPPGFPEWFGAEVSFADKLGEQYPNDKVYLIKHAWGATSLAGGWNVKGTSTGGHHDSEGLQYNRFITLITNALGNLDSAGIEYTIEGMLWMQGESDAVHLSRANAYENGLCSLIVDVRRKLKVPELPFIIARIKPYWDSNPPGGAAMVRTAQQKMAETWKSVYWFDTDSFPPSTNIHYNTEGIITLGYTFAQTYLDIPVNTIKYSHRPTLYNNSVNVITSKARLELKVNTIGEHSLILYCLKGDIRALRNGYGSQTYIFSKVNKPGLKLIELRTPMETIWENFF